MSDEGYGEELGRRLLDAGFSSLTGLLSVEDELLTERGFSEEEIAVIRGALTVEEAGDEDGMEEAADEPQVEETPDNEVEASETVVAEEESQAGGEEILPEEPAAEAEAPLTEDEATAIAELGAGGIGPTAVEEVPFGAEGAMSVKVRRNKERAAAEEAERKRLAKIEDQHAKPYAGGVPFNLGSVDVDFVPEPDPVDESAPADGDEGSGEPEAPEAPLGDGVE